MFLGCDGLTGDNENCGGFDIHQEHSNRTVDSRLESSTLSRNECCDTMDYNLSGNVSTFKQDRKTITFERNGRKEADIEEAEDITPTT